MVSPLSSDRMLTARISAFGVQLAKAHLRHEADVGAEVVAVVAVVREGVPMRAVVPVEGLAVLGVGRLGHRVVVVERDDVRGRMQCQRVLAVTRGWRTLATR